MKEDRFDAARSFANKLWNASRLLFLNMERSAVGGWLPAHSHCPSAEQATGTADVPTEDAWIFSRLNRCAQIVNQALEQHRYHEATQTLWDFVWHEFCDWYLETKKLRFQPDSGLDHHWKAALTVYETTLRLLHPFMPFLTEELWQRFVQEASVHPVSISLAEYPQPTKDGVDLQAEAPFVLLQEIVTAARELRADNKLDPKTVYPASLQIRSGNIRPEDLSVIANVARLDIKLGDHDPEARGLLRSAAAFDLRIDAQPPSSNGAVSGDSRARLEKEIANYEKLIANSRRQLSDENFVGKAPEKVVATLRAKLADYEAQLAKSRSLLEGLQ